MYPTLPHPIHIVQGTTKMGLTDSNNLLIYQARFDFS